MSITFTFADMTQRIYTAAVTQRSRRTRDKRLYRSPYGTTWREEGSGKPLPERLSVTIEVYDGGLVTGAQPSQETSETLVTYDGSQVTYSGSNVTYSAEQTAEDAADGLVSDAENAISLRTPYWTASLEGLMNAVVTPVGRTTGYRVRLEFLTRYSSGYSHTLLSESGDTLVTEAGISLGS